MQGVELFLSSVRSDITRNSYSHYLKKYMELTGLNDPLCEKDPRIIEQQIIKFIIDMKQQNKSHSAIQNYTNSVLAFYKINDIMLNTTKIMKFMPEDKRVRKDRAYTHEEISKLLETAEERFRVIILLMASSGIRVGSIPDLRLRNLDNTKLTVYENDKEEYFTFITPECKKAIDSYIDLRVRHGEKVDDDSFLIREQFNTRLMSARAKPRTIKKITILTKLIEMSQRCGIRNNQVPIAHGFRKFFTTQLVNSKLNPEIREMLLGHKIGLASAYYRPTEQEMFQEYMNAVNNLTINEENRLKIKVEKLEGDNKSNPEITKMRIELNQLQSTLKDMIELNNSKLKELDEMKDLFRQTLKNQK